jgi:hypothetical protein
MTPGNLSRYFVVPDRFVEAVKSDIARISGTSIRRVSDGRFLGFMQGGPPPEMSLIQTLLTDGRSAPTAINPVLGIANLVVSVVGVGVSVAGFLLTWRRLGEIRNQIQGAAADTNQIKVRMETRDWARLEHLLQRAEEAWHHQNPATVWREIDGPLNEEYTFWRHMVGNRAAEQALLNAGSPLQSALAAYEAAMRLAGARIQTLMLLRELPAARQFAGEVQRWHEGAMLGMNWVDLARVRAQELPALAGQPTVTRPQLRELSVGLVNRLIDTQEALATREDLLTHLHERKIDGHEYVRAAREQTGHSVMVLPVD